MEKNLLKLMLPLWLAVGFSLLLLLLRRIFLGTFNRWLQKHYPAIDNILVSVVRGPSIYLCIAGGLYVAVALSGLAVSYTRILYEITHSIVILSVTLAAANLSATLFRNFMTSTQGQKQTSGLLVGLIHGSIMVIGFLIILSVMGISIAPLLTALGVGGLAVALALKDTLENLFGGIYLLSDRAIRVGDYVKLDSGLEGFVEDIGWRTTRIRLEENNMLVLPNSKLAQSSVTNFCLPDQRVLATIVVSVSYDADPQRVEEELMEIVRRGCEDIVGLLSTPAPGVRFNPGFGIDSIDFTLFFHVKHFSDRSFVRHEVRKRIYRRFKDAGIPFPERRIQIQS